MQALRTLFGPKAVISRHLSTCPPVCFTSRRMLAPRTLFGPKLVTPRPLSTYVSRMRYLMKLKEDDQACREALASGRLLLYHKLAPLLQKNKDGTYRLLHLTTPDVEGILEKLGQDTEAIAEAVLIGCGEAEEAQFCLDVGGFQKDAMEQLCGGVFMDLRKAFLMCPGPETPLVAKGQALLRWHQTHGFCSASGQPTVRNQSGSQRVCPSSGITYYPQMAPVVIVLVSDGSRCLLARQSIFPPGIYSTLAGFCDMGETLEEALRRELAEEVGLEVETLRYSASQHWPFPQSSFMVACHATVNPDQTQVSLNKAELEDARWCTLDEVLAALQIGKPPRNPTAKAPGLFMPPAFTIANRLIQEWADQQRLKMK